MDIVDGYRLTFLSTVEEDIENYDIARNSENSTAIAIAFWFDMC